MNERNKFIRFFLYEGKLVIIALLLVFVAGCITWRTFYRTPPDSEIQRDYLAEDIANNLSIQSERVAKYSNKELEIISRLDLNGLLALEKYPGATVRVYDELHQFQLFYDIVEDFGPHHVIPVLDYFYDDENIALQLEQKFYQLIASVFNQPLENDTLNARQKRLLMILNEINYQKHNFLARFIFTGDAAKRNYVSTTTSTIVNFFTGGLSNFNEAVVTKGITKVSTEELIDAGIDILVLIPFVSFFSKSTKVGSAALKGGRVVTMSEKALTREGTKVAVKSGRFAKIARASRGVLRIIPVRTLFRFKYVKWYLLGLVIVKPSLINHAASLVAKAVSIPSIVMKTGFWFLILFPLLNLLVPLFMVGRYMLRKFWVHA